MLAWKQSFAEVVQGSRTIEQNGRRYDRIRIVGDGNCFFRSIALWIFGSEAFHTVVRRDTVEYVAGNWSRFAAKVLRSYTNCVNADAYVSYMGSNAVEGGELEILVASEIFNRPVAVYNSISKSFINVNENNSVDEPILLWYNFRGRHYMMFIHT